MNSIDFNERYERKVFMNFLQQVFLPEDFSPAEEALPIEFKPQHIDRVIHLGECRDMKLNIYEISHGSEQDPRVSLTKEAFRLMKEYNDHNALAVFISPKSDNFRFSYITMGLKPDDTKVTYEYSNPRRFSYFLGPDAKVNTPERFLIKKPRVVDIKDLQDRFSVEVVNKEFYKEIAYLFTKLVGGTRKEGNKEIAYAGILRLPTVEDRQRMQEFAVRMIGRVVFCWFLKKKNTSNDNPLIPAEILSLQAVNNENNYYHNVLEKLFFQVLNTPQEKRRQEFKTGNFSLIPFLNGGLFEPHNDDIYELNDSTGTSKFDNTLIVPGEWFEELFELLERYNFTIDENTSMDVELSVDPEMLGRIFENLLAEINPETGETAKKSTGTYYTPRPIVEFMVDESLKQYLLTKTGIHEEKLQQLLSFSEDVEELTPDETQKIIDALDAVKIIDPACGSGAFPMGILQKMVLILQKVDPESMNWLIKQLDRIPDSYVRSLVEEQLMKEDWNYIRKLGIIQNSIYGVDIQQIAVEISKLRVFLSLVVDSRIDDSAKNLGIKPLPNLEFKFVCANALIGLSKSTSSVFDIPKDINKLKSLRERYFSSIGEDKRSVERQYKEIQDKMFKHSIEMTSMGEKTLALSQWDPFSDMPADWFDPEWMFGIKDGFDIVIANPPYVRQEVIKNIKPRLKNDFGDFYCGTADLYTYFFKIGLKILRQKGHLCFISPNKFMRAGYGKNTRLLLTQNATPKTLVDFCELPVFEAGTDPLIILVEKNIPINEKFTAAVIKTEEEIKRLPAILEERGVSLEVSALNTGGWTLEKPEILNLLKKISNNGTPLGEYIHGRFYRGVLTGFNDAFVIDQETREKLISEDPNSAELIKPWLRGRDIRKWRSEWAGYYLIFTRRGIDIEKYPAIKRHLEKFREDLEPKKSGSDKRGRKPGSYKWYEIQDNIAYYEEFEKPKIVYADIAKLMRASYDTSGSFCANTLYILPTEDLYILGIFHSLLFDWYSRQTFQALGDPWKGGRLRFIAQYMEKVPMPILKDEEKIPIIKIVQQVLADPTGPEVGRLEAEIDQLVYELYNLTPEEIALVEGNTQ